MRNGPVNSCPLYRLPYPGTPEIGDSVNDEVASTFEGCRLCWALSDAGLRFPVNTQLLTARDYVVVPAVGALVPGYVLFVAKAHLGPAATLARVELDLLERELSATLTLFQERLPWKEWIVFEHGGARDGLRLCCVDHFHLHLMPFTENLVDGLRRALRSQERPVPRLSDLPDILGERCPNYILVGCKGAYFVFAPEAYSSQFVRQTIARQIDRPDGWDWRSNPHYEHVLHTIRGFRQCGLAKPTIYLAHAIEDVPADELAEYLVTIRRMANEVSPHLSYVSMYELLRRSAAAGMPQLDDTVLVQTERRYLEASDGLLVDLSRVRWQYVGALMEIVYAHLLNLPIVAVVGDSSLAQRRWLRGHGVHFVLTVKEGMCWLADHFSLERSTPGEGSPVHGP